ncbi:hypothetical protein [Bacillus thuringiensis]|nr:hypothetical protein [Bacillus thuringiensis]MBD8077296.1 hypothetical protein [Bacillus thuringiensis]
MSVSVSEELQLFAQEIQSFLSGVAPHRHQVKKSKYPQNEKNELNSHRKL